MTRLTRLIIASNSPESRLFFTSPSPRRNPSPLNLTFISSNPNHRITPPHTKIPLLQIHHFSSQNTPLPHRKTPHSPLVMETPGNPLLESDTFPPEDFVHVVSPDNTLTEISADETNPNPSPESHSIDSSENVAAAAAVVAESEAPRTDDLSLVRESEEGSGSKRDVLPEELLKGDSEGLESEKAVLPEELLKGVVFLECESSAEGGSSEVYLVGTAHVSQVPTVNEMIDMWKKKKMNPFGILYSWFLAKVLLLEQVCPRRIKALRQLLEM